MKQTRSLEELRSRIERAVLLMPDDQVVQEVAVRSEAPVGLTGSWRDVGPVPAEDFAAACLIVEKEGDAEGGLIPFGLWDAQREALEVIEREPYLVLPKGRQIGITWLELMAMARRGTFWGNRLFNIARPSGEDAKDAIRRLLILLGYDPNSEPPHMRVLPESPPEMNAWRPTVVGKTATSLTLENGSRFQAKTATRHIARGDAAYWTLCDEYAFWTWPKEQLNSLEWGAHRVHVVSTGDGDQDEFAKLYEKALSGKGKWRAHFIPATADPRRDEEYFRRNVDEATDPDLAARELARDVTDVFRPREGAFFKCFKRVVNVHEFDVVPGWPVDLCVDWGLTHPAALAIQIAPSGQPFVFDEYLPEDVSTREFGVGLRELLDGYDLAYKARGPFADPAGKARNVQTKRSEFEVFRGLGFSPQGRSSKVSDGVVLMVESIGDPHVDETGARDRCLIIHPRCVGVIAALANVQAHRNDDDVYDTDHPVYSHPLDALRYWHVCRYRAHRKASGSPGARRRRERFRTTRPRGF